MGQEVVRVVLRRMAQILARPRNTACRDMDITRYKFLALSLGRLKNLYPIAPLLHETRQSPHKVQDMPGRKFFISSAPRASYLQ